MKVAKPRKKTATAMKNQHNKPTIIIVKKLHLQTNQKKLRCVGVTGCCWFVVDLIVFFKKVGPDGANVVATENPKPIAGNPTTGGIVSCLTSFLCALKSKIVLKNQPLKIICAPIFLFDTYEDISGGETNRYSRVCNLQRIFQIFRKLVVCYW